MYPAFPAPPFTREGLARHFGFQVPPPFVTFLIALCEDCTSGEAVYNRVVGSLEWLLVSEYCAPVASKRHRSCSRSRRAVLMEGTSGI